MSKLYNKTNKITEVLQYVQWGILRKTLGTHHLESLQSDGTSGEVHSPKQNQSLYVLFHKMLKSVVTDVSSQLGANSPSIHVIEPNTSEDICILKCDSYITNTLVLPPSS